jgi:glycosyltransferase 2 family protein
MSLLSLSSLSSIPSWLMTSVQVMALLGGVGALGLFVAPRLEKHLLRAIGWLPMRSSWQMRAQSMLQQFLLGMRSLQNPGRATQFVVLTVAIWLVDAGVAMVVAQALGLHLSLTQALLLLAALGLSSAAPSTPGYVGIYQFVAVTVLMPFDFSRNQALVYIIMFQLVTYLVVSIWGGLGLWLLSRSKAGQQRAWVGHGRSH